MSEIIIKKINEPKINHDIAAEQKMWELLNKDILEAMNAEIKAAEESIKVNAKQRRANLEEELSNEREEVSVLIQQLTEEKNSLETKMANLKFFSFVAKKETQEKIEQLSRKLQEAIEKSKQYSPEKNAYLLDRAEAEELKKISEAAEEIQSKYNIPESPADIAKKEERWVRIKEQYKKDAEGTGMDAYGNKIKAMLMTLSEYGEPFTKEQFAYLLNSCFGEEVSEMRVAAYLGQMRYDPKVFIVNDIDHTYSANK